MENNLISEFKNIQDSEHKIWFNIEDIENTIQKHNSEINSDSLIMDYLESNCLELCKDKVITSRTKLDGNSTETLYNVLEGFLEYLKYHH